MLGQRIAHPKSTNFYNEADKSPRPIKRLKREEADDNDIAPRSPTRQHAPPEEIDDCVLAKLLCIFFSLSYMNVSAFNGLSKLFHVAICFLNS